jgi:hypothetical protein
VTARRENGSPPTAVWFDPVQQPYLYTSRRHLVAAFAGLGRFVLDHLDMAHCADFTAPRRQFIDAGVTALALNGVRVPHIVHLQNTARRPVATQAVAVDLMMGFMAAAAIDSSGIHLRRLMTRCTTHAGRHVNPVLEVSGGCDQHIGRRAARTRMAAFACDRLRRTVMAGLTLGGRRDSRLAVFVHRGVAGATANAAAQYVRLVVERPASEGNGAPLGPEMALHAFVAGHGRPEIHGGQAVRQAATTDCFAYVLYGLS